VPIVKLYCEGVAGSPDVRILRCLLEGYVTMGAILPDQSKFGIDKRIQIRRETVPNTYCIVDRDFASVWQTPINKPHYWQGLGWHWDRKEVENYLLDPVVVQKALGANAPANYQTLLENAADLIAKYQAARTALASYQNPRAWLNTKFGKSRGQHNYIFPDAFDDNTCQSGIKNNVKNYLSRQTITINEVLNRYQTILPEFLAGGIRRQHFLYAFSGKDLLWALHKPLMAAKVGGGASLFVESLLKGIEHKSKTEDIATWLPEWQALREIIEQI